MKGNIGSFMLIGLDTADADLIYRWCLEGYLPNLNSLLQQGTWCNLKTTAEVMHVSAWPSIYTGTLPGKHGMYHAYQISAGEQNVHRTKANECAQSPFWKFIDHAGKSSIIMDAFMNSPLESFGGVQVLEWGTWTWFSEQQSMPEAVWKDIISKFGHYPAPEHSKVLTIPNPKSFRQKLTEGAALKSKVVRWLMKEYDWEFFFVTFSEPHPAGHFLWHLSDSDYPAYSSGKVNNLGNALRDVYVAVDNAIGDILMELDDAVTVLVISGDGIGPNYASPHLLPEVLSRLDVYTEVGQKAEGNANMSNNSGISKSFTKFIRDFIPSSVRRTISRCLPRHIQHHLSMKWASANVDWTRTKAFCIPNANEGYIRVNLEGREPNGIVPTGRGYEEFCTELKEQCLELVNPLNGQIAARQVLLPHEIYSGERIGSLPDIVVNWDYDSKVLNQLYSENCGLIDGPTAGYQTPPFYTGNHRPAAFFLARGPNIPEAKTIDAGHIIDIAPTILAMMGVDLPKHFDGRVWEELL